MLQIPKHENKLVNKHAGYSDCVLVLKFVRFNVCNKVIDDYQNLSVSTLHARKWSNNVHGHAFK